MLKINEIQLNQSHDHFGPLLPLISVYDARAGLYVDIGNKWSQVVRDGKTTAETEETENNER